MTQLQLRWLAPALLCAVLSCNIYAVDGIVLIDQNRALAGGVTPGDAPGFPITISQPGSYRLSGNLTVPDANTDAIRVTASNISIDLNGFSIVGPTVCVVAVAVLCGPLGTGSGVFGNGDAHSISVSNGNISGMGQAGVSLRGAGSSIDKVHAESNGSTGFFLDAGSVSNSTSNFNRDSGFYVNSGIVRNNAALRNGADGFTVADATVSGNHAISNRGYGFSIVCPTAMIGNSAAFNFGNVLTVGTGCAFTGNAP